METLTYNDQTAASDEFATIDGMIVNVETGEIVGVSAPEGFRVKDEDSFNWVMGKMLDADSRVAAIATSQEVIRAKAVIANAEKLTKEAQNRKAWLESRFGAELAEYAKSQIEGGKSKTFKTLLGSISFRTKKGGLRVKDNDKAVAFAYAMAQSGKPQFNDAIKVVETFQISKLDNEDKQWCIDHMPFIVDDRIDDLEICALQAFTVEPDSETWSITTGVDE